MTEATLDEIVKKSNAESLAMRMAVGAGAGAVMGLMAGKFILGAAVGTSLGALLHLYRSHQEEQAEQAPAPPPAPVAV